MLPALFRADHVIVFEGIRGSGKSTQLQAIHEALRKEFAVNVFNSDIVYPTVAPFRPMDVRTLADAIQESLFFRFTRWLAPITKKPAQIALVDRFVLSDLVYFMQKLTEISVNFDEEELRRQLLTPFGMNATSGTLTLYIDCSPEEAQRRVSARKRSYFNLAAEQLAYDFYSQQLRYVENATVIDGSKGEEFITSQVMKLVGDYLEGRSQTATQPRH